MKRALLFLALALTLRCASVPGAGPPPPTTGSVVVLVPGMTGSRLCSRATGELLWGDSLRLLRPWDGGRALARPLDGGEDDVVPCGPIREMRVANWRKDIYGGLIDFMARNGVPFQVFDHDWRLDSIENARLLARELQPFERVSLICQSNAAYMCRYLVKYGDVSLDEAERGLSRPAKNVEKVILIGNANGGAIRILQELLRGRQYIRVIGRRWRPEVLATFPSLYQDLPVYRDDLVVDERGNPIDLFDPANWKRYRWSRSTDAFVAEALANARRMHALLRKNSGAPLPRYWSIQSADFPTFARARLVGGRTVFEETTPGDRHATLESQQWLSPEELAAVTHIRVEGRHFEMITTGETRAHLLGIVTGR